MALQLTLPIVVRAAGPALFALLGAAIVALSRGRRERIALGGFLLGTGATIACNNLSLAGGGAPFVRAADFFFSVAAIGGFASILWPISGPRIAAPWLVLVGLFVVAYAVRIFTSGDDLIAHNAIFGRQGPDLEAEFATLIRIGSPGEALFFALPFVWALHARDASDADMRTLAGISSGLLVWFGYNVGADVLSGSNMVLIFAPEVGFAGILAAAAAWLYVAISRENVVARNVALVALAATTIAMLRHAATGLDTEFDPLPLGLARLVGWALVALAVVHAGWLDVRFLSRHRAGLAAAAVAALFIVAQIAQNFFSAEYGLLMGGVVAGSFLFAAQPLQRAIESRRSRAEPDVEPAPARVAAHARPDAALAYKRAVRLALKDQRLTPDEEVELAHVAEALGLSGPEAARIRHETEAEEARRR